MKHFSYNSTLCYMGSLVKSVFYFFSHKNRRSGAAKHEGEEKNTSGEIAAGVLRRSNIEKSFTVGKRIISSEVIDYYTVSN